MRDSFEQIAADWVSATKSCDFARARSRLPKFANDWRKLWQGLVHESQEAAALSEKLRTLAVRACSLAKELRNAERDRVTGLHGLARKERDDMSFPCIEEPQYEWRVGVEVGVNVVFVHPHSVNVNPKAVGCSQIGEGTLPTAATVGEPCWLWRALFRATFEKRLARAKARCQRWCDQQNQREASVRTKMARLEIT